MKKSIKRIFAVVLTVMMVALMVPFSASASTNDGKFNLNLQSANEGFTFKVYQIATIDPTDNYAITTTTQNADVNTAINAAMNDSTAKTSKIIAECDKVNTWSNPVLTFTADEADAKASKALDYGIYYIKGTPNGAGKVTKNSVVVCPYFDATSESWKTDLSAYETNGSIQLGEKVSKSDLKVTKDIIKSYSAGKTTYTEAELEEYTTAQQGETVYFYLTAQVPQEIPQQFALVDYMTDGLDKTSFAVQSVAVNGTKLADADYGVYDSKDDLNALVADATKSYTGNMDKAVYLKATGLAKLTAGATVQVVCSAKVCKTATNTVNCSENTDVLVYKNVTGNCNVVNGETVKVYYVRVEVLKVDSSNTSKKLEGAEFNLVTENNSNANPIATGKTNADGVTTFGDFQVACGRTYYIVETKAPSGYVLNNTPVAVKIAPLSSNAVPATTVVKTTIKNAIVTVPQTGGMGTMMFTIGGAALIVLAGVMFIVLKRKKTSK